MKERRVHRREQLDRFRGVVEQLIEEKRIQREKEEEQLMVKEVLVHGNVLGVGGLDIKTTLEKAKQQAAAASSTSSIFAMKQRKTASPYEPIIIDETNFDPNIESKRPNGWSALRKRRVYRKEQLDRLRGVSDMIILEKRGDREREEESLMLKEVAQHGTVIMTGPGNNNNNNGNKQKKKHKQKPQHTATTVTKTAEAEGQDDIYSDDNDEEAPEELEMNFDDDEFDAKTNKRPKGTIRYDMCIVFYWQPCIAAIVYIDVYISNYYLYNIYKLS